MKLRLPSKYLLAAAIGLAATAAANAQLWFSTGVSQAANLDLKYTYRGTTTGFGGAIGPILGQAAVAHEAGFPFSTGAWTPNTAASSWLQPGVTAADGLATSNPQNTFFVFETSFVLPAGLLGSTSFGIKTTADNQLQIFDNGTAIAPPGDVDNFVIDVVDNFTLTSINGLVAGLNVIDIYVFNGANTGLNPNNPSGFRLEVTQNNLGIPEPSTYGLIGALALTGLVALRRIRSKSEVLAS